MSVRVEAGNCLEVMRRLAEEGVKVDAIVTDPPYHLTSIVNRFGKPDSKPAKSDGATGVYGRSSRGFMGKAWDGGDMAFNSVTWGTAGELLKPGGWLLAFGGTRTYHKLGWAIEGGGFEIRDQISWLYGSGFNKVGMLRNRQPEMFCDCPPSEYDVRSVRRSDLSKAVNSSHEQGQVLQSGVSEQGTSEQGGARAKSENGGRQQSSVERRPIRGAGEGIRDGSAKESSEGAQERIRSGAHPSSGGNAGAPFDGDRRSSSHQPRPGRQSAGEPADISGSQEPLGSGASGGRSSCPRCGKIPRDFDGFGGSLKPACEPICVARKFLSESSVAANVLEHGTGALNVDGCQVNISAGDRTEYGVDGDEPSAAGNGITGNHRRRVAYEQHAAGRWPANVCHDGSPEVEAAFAAFGESKSTGTAGKGTSAVYGDFERAEIGGQVGKGDSGTASRFFYTAKADAHDRWGSKHPTVKPIDLMRWLVRLVTPPGGTVLDPFAGSGTTGIAAMAESFDCILIEREEEYLADIRERLAFYEGEGRHSLAARNRKREAGHDDLPLFSDLD